MNQFTQQMQTPIHAALAYEPAFSLKLGADIVECLLGSANVWDKFTDSTGARRA